MKAIKVSKMTDGVELRIGGIVFDESNNGTLTVENRGPDGDQLRRLWEELAKRPSLRLERADRTEVDGKRITKYRSYEVKKSDEQYPAAVWSTLEREHGYLVDKER